MTRRLLIGLMLLGVVGAGWSNLPATREAKRVIGPTAPVEVSEAGMEFLGRVDTGAASTSIHAEAIQVEGDMVSFQLVDRNGTRVTMREPVVQTRLVRNPEGREKRVYVELTLRHEGHAKRVLANLNDRSELTYPLLLGRNWLRDDYLVDVTREDEAPTAGREAGAAVAQ